MTQAKQRARLRRMAGATLVEVMIVVGIITAISAMAIANMPRMSRDMRINRAAHTYAGLLREARGRAMANRAFVQVNSRTATTPPAMTISEKNCPFGTTVGDCGGGCGSGWTSLNRYTLGKGDFLNVQANSAVTIVFTPRGTIDTTCGANGGTVQFTSTVPGVSLKQTVTVNSGGWVEKK